MLAESAVKISQVTGKAVRTKTIKIKECIIREPTVRKNICEITRSSKIRCFVVVKRLDNRVDESRIHIQILTWIRAKQLEALYRWELHSKWSHSVAAGLQQIQDQEDAFLYQYSKLQLKSGTRVPANQSLWLISTTCLLSLMQFPCGGRIWIRLSRSSSRKTKGRESAPDGLVTPALPEEVIYLRWRSYLSLCNWRS